jgi:hypothetical protein
MHYLLSVAPGTYYVDGKATRIMAGESIIVEPENLQRTLEQYSFLTLIASDPESLDEDKVVAVENFPLSGTDPVGGANKVTDPDVILPIGNVSAQVYSNLSPDASAAEAVTYLQELGRLQPVPTAIVSSVAQMYPKSHRVTTLAAKILNTANLLSADLI